MKQKKTLYISMLIAGVCFSIYYLACGIEIGFVSANVWIWAVGGVLLISASLLLQGRLKKGVVPRTGKAYTLLRVCGRCVLCCALALFVFVEALVVGNMFEKAPEGLDCIIVLGAKVNGTVPSNALEYRINKAAEYMKANPGTVCVATGGKQEGDEMTEAECSALLARIKLFL
ncbi:MAG TPA: YdcF family protein, partial [Bacillota bacterium]|nr:YdcF family protein [Bacillota bacterium]